MPVTLGTEVIFWLYLWLWKTGLFRVKAIKNQKFFLFP